MMKKIFVCITLLTYINTYTMLAASKRVMRMQKQKRMYKNSKDSHIYSNISNHLNSCNPESALDKLAAIIFSSLRCSQAEKITYINDVLSRNDISPEHHKAALLLQDFFNQQKSHPFDDQDPLMYTALRENNDPLLKVVLKHGFKGSVDLPNKFGDSALYLAASQGQLPFVQTLIEHSPNINKQNNKGQTALHGIATSPLINTTTENNDALIKTMHYITNAGALTSVKDDQNKRPIDYIEGSLKELERRRSRTLLNEDTELMEVYHEMEKILRTQGNNE